MVESPHNAELIVWISTRSRLETEVVPPGLAPVVLLDYADGCTIHQYRGQLGNREVGYFKRSWMQRRDGIAVRRCTNDSTVQTFAYSGGVATEPYGPQDSVGYGAGPRYYTIVSTLRTSEGESAQVMKQVHSRRGIIASWTLEFVRSRQLKAHIGALHNDRSKISGYHPGPVYLSLIANASIVVTANPAQWEGDFRLWEALLSGACVFVDKMEILKHLPHPPVHRRHLVEYDPSDKEAFLALLQEFVEKPALARRIGRAGRHLVLTHHMPVDRADYILSHIPVRRHSQSSPNKRFWTEMRSSEGHTY